MTRKERYTVVLETLKEKMPNVSTELMFGSAFQLLVATMLSAQCTDARVNMVTPELFRRFPDAKAMAEADEADLLECVKSVSYPNAKAHHLLLMAQRLKEVYDGVVPSSFEDLESLPGVGHKTANVMRAVWFGIPSMPVDTHVFRVSHRLGLVPKNADTPLKVETHLLKNIPNDCMTDAHHWLLLHGRYTCLSRRPKCEECEFASFCPSSLT